MVNAKESMQAFFLRWTIPTCNSFILRTPISYTTRIVYYSGSPKSAIIAGTKGPHWTRHQTTSPQLPDPPVGRSLPLDPSVGEVATAESVRGRSPLPNLPVGKSPPDGAVGSSLEAIRSIPKAVA